MKGFKIHKLNNGNLKCLEVPRDLIKFVKDQTNITNSSIYFLIDEENNGLYVGQTDNFFKRMNEHNRLFNQENKDNCIYSW